MNENVKNTPIDVLANVLAEMSTRAYNAEAVIEKLKADDGSWYKHWQTKDAEVKKITEELNELKRQFHDLMNERNDLKDAYDQLKQREDKSHE